jgi:hypothetical protein
MARRLWPPLLLFLVAAASLLNVLRGLDLPVMQPDSTSYLSWSSIRTIGYPAFLSSVEATVGLADLPRVQATIFAMALLLLALALRRALGSVVPALFLLVAVGFNPEVQKYHALVLSESLSISLSLIAFAALAAQRRRDSAALIVLAALAIGLAALVRPVLLALFWLPVAVALLGPFRWRRAAAALAVCAAVVGLGSWANGRLHRDAVPNEALALHLIGKVAPLITPAIPAAGHAGLAEALAKPADELQRIEGKLGSWDLVYLARAPYYDYARFGLIPDWAAGLPSPRLAPAIEQALALDAIARRPLAYLADVALNFYALWSLPDLMTSAGTEEAATLSGALNAAFKLRVDAAARPRHIVWGIKAALALCFLTGLWFTVAVLRRPGAADAAERLGALAFLATVALFLATALLQAGLPRYALAAWPFEMIVLAAGGARLSRRLQPVALAPLRKDEHDPERVLPVARS